MLPGVRGLHEAFPAGPRQHPLERATDGGVNVCTTKDTKSTKGRFDKLTAGT